MRIELESFSVLPVDPGVYESEQDREQGVIWYVDPVLTINIPHYEQAGADGWRNGDVSLLENPNMSIDHPTPVTGSNPNYCRLAEFFLGIRRYLALPEHALNERVVVKWSERVNATTPSEPAKSLAVEIYTPERAELKARLEPESYERAPLDHIVAIRFDDRHDDLQLTGYFRREELIILSQAMSVLL
ncbi:MAG: hypothetical protein ACN6I5_01385 [Hyphomicrobiales bacterium]